MTDCVIQADFVNWRPVTGRKVLQLVFEVDIMHTQDVLEKLGTPTPGTDKWCAIALLDLKPKAEGQAEHSEAAPPKKSWGDYKRSNQAAILCDDPDFWEYFGTTNPADAAAKLRRHFHIESRSELDNPANHARWDEFVAIYHMKRPLRGAK